MPADVAALVTTKVKAVAEDPLAPNNNVKKLTGRPGYRLRVGDWRVVYDLQKSLRVLSVERIGPRGKVYE